MTAASLTPTRMSLSAIARDLGLSQKTVSDYLSNIFAKLQVADPVQAALRAREAGLGGSVE